MVDVQNATLAGGVAMGAACNMNLHVGWATLIGAIAGLISVFGYVKVSPILQRLGIDDTCGVNNLHGMPSLFGALVSILAARSATADEYGAVQLAQVFPGRSDSRGGGAQSGIQLAFMITTLIISIVGGLITGAVVRRPFFEPLKSGKEFDDAESWEVPSEELPYYFAGEPEKKQ